MLLFLRTASKKQDCRDLPWVRNSLAINGQMTLTSNKMHLLTKYSWRQSLGSQAIWARVPTLAEPVTLEASSLWSRTRDVRLDKWQSNRGSGCPRSRWHQGNCHGANSRILAKPGALAAGLAVGKMRGPLTVVGCLGGWVCWPFRRPDLQPVCLD